MVPTRVRAARSRSSARSAWREEPAQRFLYDGVDCSLQCRDCRVAPVDVAAAQEKFK